MTRLALLFFAAVLSTGCSSLETSHDYDPDADFGALRTYAWIEPPEDDLVHQLNYRRCVSSVDAVLAAKGFRLDPDAPDFLIAAHLGTERQLRVTDWGYGYRRGASGVGPRELEVHEYEEGTLVLDVVVARTSDLAWRGSARRTIDRSATPEERTERIRDAVEKVLEPFPPSPDPPR